MTYLREVGVLPFAGKVLGSINRHRHIGLAAGMPHISNDDIVK